MVKNKQNKTEEAFPKQGNCSLCGNEYYNWGHNPDPVKPFEERVCDECNKNIIIPTRMGMHIKDAFAKSKDSQDLKDTSSHTFVGNNHYPLFPDTFVFKMVYKSPNKKKLPTAEEIVEELKK